jgi:hypothetical protein
MAGDRVLGKKLEGIAVGGVYGLMRLLNIGTGDCDELKL